MRARQWIHYVCKGDRRTKRYIAWSPFGVSINLDGGEFSVIEAKSLHRQLHEIFTFHSLCAHAASHYSHSTRKVSARCEIIIKTENAERTIYWWREKDIPFIPRVVYIHGEFASHSQTSKPCCSCNTRAASSPTFFNTLFVSLGIVSPACRPAAAILLSILNVFLQQCASRPMKIAPGEHNGPSRPTLRHRRGSPSKNPRCVYRHTCRHVNDTSCRYIRRLRDGRAAILV